MTAMVSYFNVSNAFSNGNSSLVMTCSSIPPKLIFDVDKYVGKFTDESSISKAIVEIEELLSEVYMANFNIENTKRCTFDNYTKLNTYKNMWGNKSYHEVLKENQNCDTFNGGRRCNVTEQKIVHLNKQFSEFDELKSVTNNLHLVHLGKNTNYYEYLPVEIKMLNLVWYNIKAKQYLVKLLEEFKTQEIIIKVLSELYKKVINLNISSKN